MFPLRFLRCWNGIDRGTEVPDFHEGLASELVQMGIAERIANPKAPEKTPVKPNAKGRSSGTGTVHA